MPPPARGRRTALRALVAVAACVCSSTADAESAWSLVDDRAAFNATTNAHNRKIAEAGPYLFLGYHVIGGRSVFRKRKY